MSSTTCACVDPSSLLAHLLAELPPADEARLIAHLDTCGICQETLQSLAENGSGLLDTARRIGREGTLVESAPDHLLADLEQACACPSAAWELAGYFDPPADPAHLGRISHYEVLSIAGQGGMGIALKALDEKLSRVVCLKVLGSSSLASASARQRFLREARAAAGVRSDHVVTVYAVEEHRGRPYLAMEYISGNSLQEELRKRGPLPPEEVARIGREIALGLAAAHERGLVHRDIKPANILLEEGTGRVKITDFGLARAMDDGQLTREGTIAGTPEFMAPEQARGAAVDHRADLFSLGSVLYAMASGRSPFSADGALAALRRIAEDSPAPLGQANPDVPHWLDEIVARLHAKNPAHRFQSAEDVADALLRGLSCHGTCTHAALPVAAAAKTKPSFVRRIGAIALAATLLMGIGIALQVIVIKIRDKDGKEKADQLAGGSTLIVERDGQKVAEFGSDGTEMRQLAGHRGRVWSMVFAGNRLITGGDDGWVRVWDVASGKEVQRFDGHPHIVYALAVSPNGKFALTGSGREGEEDVDWTVCLWDIATGTELKRLAGHGLGVTSVAFTADGSQAVIGEFSGTIRLMDVATWSEVSRLSIPRGVWSIAISPNEKQLLTAGGSGDVSSVRLWNLRDGKELQRYEGHRFGAWHAVFVPKSETILSGGQDDTMRRWSAATGKQMRLYPHDGQVARIAVSADGQFALAGTWGKPEMRKLKLWRLETGETVWEAAGHGAAINAVALSPDGEWAASGAQDGGVRLWRIAPHLAGKKSPAKGDK